jgi:hypothetical protein
MPALAGFFPSPCRRPKYRPTASRPKSSASLNPLFGSAANRRLFIFVYRSYLMTKSLSEYRKSLFISSMSELKRGSVEAFLSNRIFLLLSFSASYTTTRTFLTDLNFLGSLIVNSLFLITYVFSNVIFLNFPKVTKNTRKKSSNFLWSWYKLFYLEQEQSHTNCTILPVLDPINWDCFVRLYRFPSLSRT